MRLELKRGLFLAFLVLITLFLSWSLFFTGENIEKLTYVGDEEKLYEAVIVKQINSPPLPWAKDPHERGLKVELKRKRPQPPSPRRPGNPGPHP
ncbi:hypothetical protein CMV_024175 [Castanea mollissima]|uniref:Uncharacterized protein n=1 Tax=Castanea mollissima TaxID=60419 RepID=A0A8J4QEQ7_9ROSI|nr:hypothetical protein CMV_024175 [Castanea mollissima]